MKLPRSEVRKARHLLRQNPVTESWQLQLEEDGFAILPQVFTREEAAALIDQLPSLDGAAGTRTVLSTKWGRALASDPRVRGVTMKALGPGAEPRRGILFDKYVAANWNLGWHQDTKIAVRGRVNTSGFVQWSVKEGTVHCQPPAEVLEKSLAVRIHLDDCPAENGALRVLPGTHKSGFISDPASHAAAREVVCSCLAGDVILMRPLLLHASSKAEVPCHRRVIHIEFSSAELPEGLEWVE